MPNKIDNEPKLPQKIDRISLENSSDRPRYVVNSIKVQLNSSLSKRLAKPTKQRSPMLTHARNQADHILSSVASGVAYAGIVAACALTINSTMQRSDTQIASELSDRCYETLGQQSKTCSIANFL
jgi:hypothetical protein